MYTNYKYSIREVIVWTHHEALPFFVFAVAMTGPYELAGWHWLQIHWTPAIKLFAIADEKGIQLDKEKQRKWNQLGKEVQEIK